MFSHTYTNKTDNNKKENLTYFRSDMGRMTRDPGFLPACPHQDRYLLNIHETLFIQSNGRNNINVLEEELLQNEPLPHRLKTVNL